MVTLTLERLELGDGRLVVGKLIVYAATREEALRKMRAALCELVIDGIETNISEQLRIISDPRFASRRYDLTMMEDF